MLLTGDAIHTLSISLPGLKRIRHVEEARELVPGADETESSRHSHSVKFDLRNEGLCGLMRTLSSNEGPFPPTVSAPPHVSWGTPVLEGFGVSL